MPKLLIHVTGALLVSLVLAAGLLAASGIGAERDASGAKAGFNPDKYAGDWEGSWHNETFDTTGPATMELTVKGKRRKFIGVFDLGGNAFGCPDADPRTVKMKKGKGDDSWNKKGFRASWENDHGPLHISYEHATKSVSGDGVSPCGADIAYTYEGKLTKKKLNADVDITLGGDPFATSTLEMTKQPG